MKRSQDSIETLIPPNETNDSQSLKKQKSLEAIALPFGVSLLRGVKPVALQEASTLNQSELSPPSEEQRAETVDELRSDTSEQRGDGIAEVNVIENVETPPLSMAELLALFFAEVTQHSLHCLPRDVLSYLTQVLFFPPSTPPPWHALSQQPDDVGWEIRFSAHEMDPRRDGEGRFPARKEREARRHETEGLAQRNEKERLKNCIEFTTSERVEQYNRWKQEREQRWQESEVLIKLWERNKDREAAQLSCVIRLLGSLTRGLHERSLCLLELLYSQCETPNSQPCSEVSDTPQSCNPISKFKNSLSRTCSFSEHTKKRIASFCDDYDGERLRVPGWQVIYVRRRCDGDGLEEDGEGTEARVESDPNGEAESQLQRRYHHSEEREDWLLTKPTHLPHVTLPKKSSYPWIEGFDKKAAHALSGTWGKGMIISDTVIPAEVSGLSADGRAFDSRHDAIVNAFGKYTGPPNCHPYTVTNGTTLTELYPEIDSIKCLFFIVTDRPLPQITSLEYCFCLGEGYTLGTYQLSAAVYECGKRFPGYSRQTRGVEYLKKLTPNLKRLKLTFPYVVWTDSSTGDIRKFLKMFNLPVEFWSLLHKYCPDLEYVMVEYWDSDKEAVMQVYYKRDFRNCVVSEKLKDRKEKKKPFVSLATNEGSDVDSASDVVNEQ